jgi:FkbH-like protein
MYELEATDRRERERFFSSHPELKVRESPETMSSANRLSLLAWSEHCVECAVPHCYATCDLYRPRADQKCRRFTFGIARNDELRTWLPYAVEVDFRVISHIWTKGNIRTVPLTAYRLLDRTQRLLGMVAKATSALLAPIVPKRTVTRGFYHYRKQLVRALQRGGGRKADGFLLQVINPHQETLALRMIVAPEPETRGPQSVSFNERFDLPPGFTERWVPVSRIAERVDLDQPFEMSLLLGNVEPRLLYFLAAEFVAGISGPITQGVAAARPAAAKADVKKVKCVVWDLDNTLWDGVLVESGGTAPKLRPGVLDIVRALDERGILQSVASKNNHDEAWSLLEAYGLAEYMLFPQINWGPKSAGLRAIAEQLNIGLDTLALVDDQPFERGEIAANASPAIALADSVIPTLLQDPRFAGSSSAEARQRRGFYQTEMKRHQVLSSFNGDYIDFLRDSQIVLDIHPPLKDEIDRLHELIQRTNQMNFSGTRYSRPQLAEVLDKPDLDGFTLHVVDRYGDYGIVGFALLRRRDPVVRMVDLAMSCRVQAKHVEHAMLLALMERYRRKGYSAFEAEYRRTDRNAPASQVFADLAFERQANEGDLEVYRKDLTEELVPLDYLEVHIAQDEVIGQP